MQILAQILSLVGAVLILYGYLALQRGWMAREDRAFNLLNFFGGLMLTVAAIHTRNVGLIILEASWALLSIPGSIKPGTSKHA